MPDDDRALLARVAGRDRGAFEALYERYFRRLFGFVFKITRRGDLVEEIVQETLLVVWRDATRFDGRSRVSTWILGIAYRRALKVLSGESHRQAREERVASEAPPPAARPEAEARLFARERADAIWRALAELSPEQRAVVDLTFYEGCSYGEIATVVGCPVNTVKTRMFHARRRLRELLPELGVADAGSA
jgi:RNA polymerase sigma-70 factor (ECF subfamily)